MTRLPPILVPLLLALVLPVALAQPAAAQSRTGCFTLVSGDPAGWGSMTQVCPRVDRPRDPRPVRLR